LTGKAAKLITVVVVAVILVSVLGYRKILAPKTLKVVTPDGAVFSYLAVAGEAASSP